MNQQCNPILYGAVDVLYQVAKKLDLNVPGEVRDFPVIEAVSAGHFSAATGRASLDALDAAIADAINGDVAAIVTGPIQKEAWNMANIEYPGHTEVLADRTGCEDYCMMLTSPSISCVLVTIHVPLADVPKMICKESISRAIRLAHDALSRRHGRPARLTVCGLNPHAGENGMFSHGEEQSIIRPAVEAARESGIPIDGPVPPDTAFTPSMRSKTDGYICMYHDQGLIPLKALSFDDAVNVTLGLPIVRTSVDHGTAMDLAWKGIAKHTSMLAAIEMAVELARSRKSDLL